MCEEGKGWKKSPTEKRGEGGKLCQEDSSEGRTPLRMGEARRRVESEAHTFLESMDSLVHFLGRGAKSGGDAEIPSLGIKERPVVSHDHREVLSGMEPYNAESSANSEGVDGEESLVESDGILPHAEDGKGFACFVEFPCSGIEDTPVSIVSRNNPPCIVVVIGADVLLNGSDLCDECQVFSWIIDDDIIVFEQGEDAGEEVAPTERCGLKVPVQESVSPGPEKCRAEEEEDVEKGKSFF